tara:strand:- start:1792 stop:2658 length:867 start_codon:yes stop_codon:yes gene_type:complete
MKKIGIIGNGFVGSSVQFGFSAQTGCNAQVKIYDVDPSKSTNTLSEVVNLSEFIFMSVPTPSNENGSINLDIIYDAFEKIAECKDKYIDNVILIRSTVTPGTTRAIQEKYPDLNIIFNPEFLTERSAKFDFINQSRFILGGKKRNTKKVADLFRWRFGETTPIIETNYETAELIKYMNNCFFATKISFMNEMKIVAHECGADWEKAVEGFQRDGRIGHSHLSVPGPDGRRGFGGSCFPKDIQAMINFCQFLGVPSNVLRAAWETNLIVRPERDWEKLKGRAVVDKKSK